jgi:uncharacterized membrane protein
MTYKEFADVVAVVFWPLSLSATLIVGVAYLCVIVVRRRSSDPLRGAGPFLVAFTTLGLVVGFAAGHSREAALGAVLPALLTLISGVLTYSLSKEGLAPFRAILPHCITILCVGSIVGLSIGGTVRKRFSAYDRALAERQSRLEKVTYECEKARYLTDLEIYKAQRLADLATDSKIIRPPAP